MVLDGPGRSGSRPRMFLTVKNCRGGPGRSGTIVWSGVIRVATVLGPGSSVVAPGRSVLIRGSPGVSYWPRITPAPLRMIPDPARWRSVLAPGRSGMIRVGTGMVRCHPCWHRVGTGVVRDGPWRLRAGSGMICTAAEAMPGRSGAVRSGTVLGPGRRSAVAIFWTKHPGPSRITPDHGPGWSGVVRSGPCSSVLVRLYMGLGLN